VDKKIVFSFLVMAVCLIGAYQMVKADQKRLSEIPVWERSETGTKECLENARDIEHLHEIFSLTEEAKTAKLAEGGCLYTYDDNIKSYEMVVKDTGTEKIRNSFGTWEKNESGSVLITGIGASAPYEIKL